MKEEIPLYYNRHKKEWYHKKEKLSDIQSYEDNLFASINEIVTMIEYINSFSYTHIDNLINVLPMTLLKQDKVSYLHIDFSDPVIQINKYDVELVVHHQLFNKLPPLPNQIPIDERSKKSLDKLFIIKVENDGVIKKDAVIYNYLFTFIKIMSGIEYSNDIGTISDYLSLADMNKI